MNDIMEQLNYVFNKEVIIKRKKGGVLTFELTHSLHHSEWVESDGDIRVVYHDNENYRIAVYNYTYALLVKEKQCMYESCVLYLSKERYQEGVNNVKDCCEFF